MKALVLALVLLQFAAVGARAQDARRLVPTPTPAWQFLPSVARVLAERFTTTQRDSLSHEYAACLGYRAVTLTFERFYLILSVRFPPQETDILRHPMTGRIVAYSVTFACSVDEIMLHSHSPHYCVPLGLSCTGDPPKYALPSAPDRDNAKRFGRPLTFIQYGPTEFMAYWPDSVPAWRIR